MNIQIMNRSLLIIPNFIEDVKHLCKKHKLVETTLDFNIDPNDNSSDYLLSIPIINSIVTYFINVCDANAYNIFDYWDKQPYINKGWKVYKVRYGFAKRSKKDGLRIIIAENRENNSILLVHIAMKNEIQKENKYQEEVIKRLEGYLGC